MTFWPVNLCRSTRPDQTRPDQTKVVPPSWQGWLFPLADLSRTCVFVVWQTLTDTAEIIIITISQLGWVGILNLCQNGARVDPTQLWSVTIIIIITSIITIIMKITSNTVFVIITITTIIVSFIIIIRVAGVARSAYFAQVDFTFFLVTFWWSFVFGWIFGQFGLVWFYLVGMVWFSFALFGSQKHFVRAEWTFEKSGLWLGHLLIIIHQICDQIVSFCSIWVDDQSIRGSFPLHLAAALLAESAHHWLTPK